MINKRNLKCLEGLLLLISLYKTESKRQTASIMELSVDTVNKYIASLEADVGTKLLINFRHNCVLTAKGIELVNRAMGVYTENWLINQKNFNLLNLKTLRGIFYLKAIAVHRNKRNASQMLAASVETINSYIEYLEKFLNISLMQSDNQGSYPTFSGKKILLKFDKLLEILSFIYQTGQANKEQKIRLALSYDINADIVAAKEENISQDIMIFADDPNLHSEDWDIAITYSEPIATDLSIILQRKIPCGFFASQEYLNRFGCPKDIYDIQQNHRILDGSLRPYADRKYRSLIQNCQKICPIANSSIILPDMARYGAGICIVPMTISQNDLIYLDNLSCEAKATLYLSAHKTIKDSPKYQTAINNCRQRLNKFNCL